MMGRLLLCASHGEIEKHLRLHASSYGILKIKYCTASQPLGHVVTVRSTEAQIPGKWHESCPLWFSPGRDLTFFLVNVACK